MKVNYRDYSTAELRAKLKEIQAQPDRYSEKEQAAIIEASLWKVVQAFNALKDDFIRMMNSLEQVILEMHNLSSKIPHKED